MYLDISTARAIKTLRSSLTPYFVGSDDNVGANYAFDLLRSASEKWVLAVERIQGLSKNNDSPTWFASAARDLVEACAMVESACDMCDALLDERAMKLLRAYTDNVKASWLALDKAKTEFSPARAQAEVPATAAVAASLTARALTDVDATGAGAMIAKHAAKVIDLYATCGL